MIEALWGWPPPVLDPAGPYADKVTTLAWALFGLGVVVTAVVSTALWVAVRGSPCMKSMIGSERAIWIGGVAFPGVILLILLVWGLTLTASLTEPIRGDEMRVRVTGEMWWFRVQYLNPDGDVVMEDANELHLPVGVPVVLELEAADVIHSFWVPHLSGKKDMIPGRRTFLRVQADRAGEFGGVCAEYCGSQHALMGFVAIAHQPSAWQTWFDERTARVARTQRLAEAAPPGATPSRVDARSNLTEPVLLDRYEPRSGMRLFMDSGCAACHRIAGTEANGLAGPDLTHVGSRRSLGAGILPNNRGTMMGWIGDSQSIKPGNRMPSYDILSAEDIGHIAAFLELQK